MKKKRLSALLLTLLLLTTVVLTGCANTEKEAQLTNQNSTTNAQTNTITLEEAKGHALNDAKVKEADATFTKIELDEENGVKHYDVKFVVDNVEYEYEINAATGEVVGVDVDKEKQKNTTTKPAEKTQEITEAKAKKIALNHAGVEDATFTKVMLDFDDGVKYYDVEFYVGNIEYDYEINAKTGVIIDFDKDIDDDYKVNATKPAPPATQKPTQKATQEITKTDAKNKALSHAGVKKADFIKIESDYDDGIKYYDVEFRVGNVEYDYEINAKTGKIIKAEKEIDD